MAASSSGGTVHPLSTAISSAITAIPTGSTADEAYKAFMGKLGEGFTDAIGDALKAAVEALGQANASTPDPRMQYIAELIGKGCIFRLGFSSPGLTVPSTEKVSTQILPIGTASSSGIGTLGGSVGVTGSYSF